MNSPTNPLVLTLKMDRASFARLDSERRSYFPASRNIVPAHISMFHQLPDEAFAEINRELLRITESRCPFRLEVTGLRSLGGGVAYLLQSPDLLALRATLAATFSLWLSRQDQQPYRPHITIQNKASREEARETLAKLQSGFARFTLEGTGLCLWDYLNGPWRLRRSYSFGLTSGS